MPKTDPRVDAYIAKAQPFAQPILRHLRRLIHKGCPECVETIKWGFPHFDYKGGLCSFAAFKAHCAFGFWKAELLTGAGESLELKDRSAMGHLGRIASKKDLPSDATIRSLIRQAVRLNDEGVKTPRAVTRKPPVRVPAWFTAALRRSPKALATFEGFSPSHRREYIEWVTEAKAEATRERRLATALEWLAEGKHRNWKYERPAAASKSGAVAGSNKASARAAPKAPKAAKRASRPRA